MSRDPAKAETLLRDSSNFDPSNRTASEALAALTEKIQAAKTVVYDALT